MPPRMHTFKPPTNPFLQVIYFLVGCIVLIGAFLLGTLILSIVFGFAVILGLVIYVRVWWLKRKFARSGAASSARPSQTTESEVIEVEYTVVDERDDQDT